MSMQRMMIVASCMAVLLSAWGPKAEAQAVSSPLTTTFAGGNGQAGNMFEVKSLTGVVINDFDINFSSLSGDFEVWVLNSPGSYIFQQHSSANWSLLATVSGLVSRGESVPTPMGLNLNFDLPAGVSQSFYITTTNGAFLSYTNGTGFGNLFSSNADLEIYEGHGGAYFDLIFVPRVWNGRIHYSPRILDDVALVNILAPSNDTLDCSPRSATETVSLEIRNGGLNPIPTGTPLSYSFSVDGGPMITEIANTPNVLNPGDMQSFTFVATADLSTVGSHTIVVSVSYGNDTFAANDSVTESIGSGGQLLVSNFPYRETFALAGFNGSTTMPVGWVQESTDGNGIGSDWLARNDRSPTAGNGPTADYTTMVPGIGGYVFVDDTGDQSAVVLRSPCFDMSALTNPVCHFFVHSNSPFSSTSIGDESVLFMDVFSQTTGLVTTNVAQRILEEGPDWTRKTINLAAFVGEVIQVIFRVNTMGSIDNLHDIAIDNFTLSELASPVGQSPQPFKAILDINNAHNENIEPVQVGINGPYFVTTAPGGSLHFTVKGEAFQPVLIFAGPLNPVAATFPGIGTVDLGGAIGVNGIPSGLVVVADGNLTFGLNGFFNLAANGQLDFGFSIPHLLPPGLLGAFQCVIPSSMSASGLALSNAVEVILE